MKYKILKNCRELLTINENSNDLIGLQLNISLLIEGERIKRIGNYKDLINDIGSNEFLEIDCSDCVVMPGYVDSHTHLIFGRSRVDEYEASLTHTPDEIKKIVGRTGLDASMYFTRNATDKELIESSLTKLSRMLQNGTTTVEIKSGYGIDKETELRLLRLIQELKYKTPQTLYVTYLGAHYFDVEMGKEEYINFMIKKVMPIIEAEKLADFNDVWCDEGYYTAEDSYKVLEAGLKFGMIPSIHTECYSAIGGARIAAELKAANAGHLNYISVEDIIKLRDNGVVGILLPGTDFAVKHHKPFNPEPMLRNGLEIAIATNLNPGNWTETMQMAMMLACRNHRLTAEQALRATTLGGAKALKIDADYGSLEEGKFADIQILKSDSYKNTIYKFAVNEVSKVIKKGKIVVDRDL